MERFSELRQVVERRLPQMVDGRQQTPCQGKTLTAGPMLLQQQIAEVLFEAGDDAQRREAVEVKL